MLAVIIVTYNSHRQISDCLASVFLQKTSSPLSVIVIDNNSADRDKTEKILRSFDRLAVEYIQNSANYGFAKAVNQGITIARNKYQAANFLLINPDATLEENCIENLLQSAKNNPAVGLVSATILNPKDESVWFSQGLIDWQSQKTHHISEENNHSMTNRRRYLTGCCLMITANAVDRIGLFDERFFLYYEDADYSLRAQSAELSIVVADSAVCWHEESQSSEAEAKTYFLCKSGLHFFHKHNPWYRRPYFWLIFLLRLGYHKYWSKKQTVWQALADFKREITQK